MTESEADRCAEAARFRKIDAAFRAGDLAALRAAVDDPSAIPNGALTPHFTHSLEYAIYWSPLAFIRELLDLGADPNPEDHAGFPPLIAALCKARPAAGSPARDDVPEIVAMLLECGANPNQRGVNDETPLHRAVADRDLGMVRQLLAGGADPDCKTRIDDCISPLEMAREAGLTDFVAALTARPRR